MVQNMCAQATTVGQISITGGLCNLLSCTDYHGGDLGLYGGIVCGNNRAKLADYRLAPASLANRLHGNDQGTYCGVAGVRRAVSMPKSWLYLLMTAFYRLIPLGSSVFDIHQINFKYYV